MAAIRYDRQATFDRLSAKAARDALFNIHVALWPKLIAPDADVSAADFLAEVAAQFGRLGLDSGAAPGEVGSRQLVPRRRARRA